jgi:NADPH2:quinone reductase
MKAIVVDKPGGPEVLAYRESPDPIPGPHQLLVRVAAAGVNFIDIYQREGLYTMPLPYTPGLEGAGVVVDVGTSVATFAPGDQVAWAGMLGSYAEMIALDADAAVAIPEGVSLEHAAQAMLQGMTAHYLVTSVWEIQPGQTALVHAAAGGVGLLLCQMITARGGQVIGTVSTDAKATAARAAGASHIIRYDTEDVPGRVREIVKEGVDVVYDGVGRDTFMGSLKSLRPRGMVALFGQSSGPVEAFDPQLLNQGGSLIITRPSLAHFTATPGELQWRAGEVLGSLASGSIHFALAHRYPLSEAGAAHAALKARTTSGKLIIIP